MNATKLTLPDDTFAPLREFFAYWCSLPKTEFLPRLSDYFDHAPVHLQPYVAIIDVQSLDDMRVRLFGTALVQHVAFDPTGNDLDTIFAKELRPQAHKMLWTAVTHPVGYLCSRRIVTGRGFINEHPSIGLPVSVPTSGLRAVLTYSRSRTESPLLEQQNIPQLITALTFERWIDLGAGVPVQATS